MLCHWNVEFRNRPCLSWSRTLRAHSLRISTFRTWRWPPWMGPLVLPRSHGHCLSCLRSGGSDVRSHGGPQETSDNEKKNNVSLKRHWKKLYYIPEICGNAITKVNVQLLRFYWIRWIKNKNKERDQIYELSIGGVQKNRFNIPLW